MNNKFIFAAIIILILGFGIFLIKWENNSGNAVNGNVGEKFQKVMLSYKNGNYYPNTVTVKANEPVRIYLDSSITGCYRGFTLRDFGIAKYLATPEDYIEFTPTKKGSYRFACSMGMGTGTLIVE